MSYSSNDPAPQHQFALVSATHADFYAWLYSFRVRKDTDAVVIHLRGKKMRGVEAAFDEISASLQFPHYFGENWSAVNDCLCDLSWLPARSYCFGFFDADQILVQDTDDVSAFVRCLQSAGEFWSSPIAKGEWWDRPARPFNVLMQCDPSAVEQVRQRFKTVGLCLELFTI